MMLMRYRRMFPSRLAVLLFVISSVQFCLANIGCAEPSCEGAASEEDVCRLWGYKHWNLAGVNYAKGDRIGEVDVVVPMTNHAEKVWPMWTRYHYFWKPNNIDSLVFSPGLDSPFECHESLWNVRINRDINMTHDDDESKSGFSDFKNYPIEAARPIRVGDPILLPCFHEGIRERKAIDSIEEFPLRSAGGFAGKEMEWLHENAHCIDNLRYDVSNIPGAGRGAFAKGALQQGFPITYGPAIHLHRSELLNITSKEKELILNYCIGRPESDLLLLPTALGSSYINHDAKRANVKIEWIFDMNGFFVSPSYQLVQDSELSFFYVKYVALRDIEAGEEILLNYGADWQEAWDESLSSKTPFRHEIGLPGHLFPRDWLEKEESAKKPSEVLSIPELKPGEVKQLTLEGSDEKFANYLHRVKMPAGLSEKLLEFGERTGIMDIFRNYILKGNALEIDGEEHHQIDGGRWWVKRFDSEWHSDMHYITPDDDKSNDDFMRALGDAGFDEVLDAMGKHFGNIDGLLCYYPSFIAVSHCTGTMLHSDSDPSDGKRFNLIFPVMQVNNSDPELNLGADWVIDENGLSDPDLVVPYRYEPDVAVALGDNGLHGTAPCDYRDIRQMRVVVSVYMMDVNEDNLGEMYWENDPPYPRKHIMRKFLMDRAGSHWKRDDPSKKLPKRDKSSVKPW